MTLLLLGGCTLVGEGPARAPAPAAPAGPAISEGASTEARDRAAAELLAEAETRLRSGDAQGARTLARDVVARYPEARGSSAAFWTLARAERNLGAWPAAEGAAARYVELAGRSHAEGAAAQLLLAEARHRGGLGQGIETLFDVPVGAPVPVREEATGLAREIAREMNDPALRDLMEEAPRHPWILPVFQVELGERRVLVGDGAGGRTLAEAALILEPLAMERSRAERILSGEIAPPAGGGARVSGVLGVVLSEEGSPGLQQLSRQIRDGVEVALLDERFRGGVQLQVSDDGGTASRAAAALAGAEERSAFAVIGPLTDPAMAEAARGRRGPTPMVSPTVRILPQGLEGVYSIAGADPEASRVLAELAWRDGMRQLVVFHRFHPEEEAELRWFREAFEARGGQVLRTYGYAPGSTTFDEQLRAIASLRPRGVVLFVPPEDAELVGPQLAFYGVDDVEDLVLYAGPSWSTEGVLQGVPVRHTEGVRTVTSWAGEGFGPEWRRFIETYEAHFQRTLRSPVPALGWDAARIVLEAASLEGSTPEGVARGLARIRDLPGATGTFSWREGRLGRNYVPVIIENRTLVPLTPES
jgi:ABC-type branched-subunit amino acid transport system substrate-binding protein